MEKTVMEAAKLAGVSVRTLHYYDQIGLLKPEKVNESGYRFYSESDLERLFRILFYKELDFSLDEIRELLSGNKPVSRMDENRILSKHKNLLIKKRDRLNGIIDSVDKLLTKGFDETMLKDFDMKEIEEAKKQYGEEARQRYGGTEAYKESARRTAAYTKEDWAKIKAETEAVYADFITAMNKGPESEEAQKAVVKWKNCISDNFYQMTPEILAGLGELYIADERFTKNIDRYQPGLADFMSRAIAIYCKSINSNHQ